MPSQRSPLRQPFLFARAVAEGFGGGADAVEHGEVEVGQAALFWKAEVTAGAERVAAVAEEEDRQVVVA